MKNVLIISNMFPSKKGPTFGIFVKNQAKQLELAGMSVDILAIKDPSMDKINVLKKYITWFLYFCFNLLTKGWKYDIVHVHYIFPTGILGLFYKKLFNIPLVVTAHGGDIDKMAKKNKFFKKCTEVILKEADYVICVGDQLYSNVITEYNIPSNKITVLNMGVDTKIFCPKNKNELRNNFGIPASTKVILFVGNIIKQKGVKELVTAYKNININISNTQLVIIGAKKDPSFFKDLELFIKDNKLKDISILEPKTQKEISEWMGISNVFVLPSHIEGLGLVALEAMACKVPVVASRVGGLQYLLADGVGFLVPPKNHKELEDTISYVLLNEENSYNIIERAYQKALESDSDKVINKLQKIYTLIENS
ncbi:glycosyltransferase involved in cell wall biosynthesis [Neobacillus niacini]|uniref:glycosyltransferase n=1 Tax=Neobacillus niacini TaxID=86668 RepID=UPI00285DED58|nr:glycosyltransferase [Neobacillus niacini]MDR7078854.1 glycosyltransferase involved in cell wall biosynthesis [Neobacillus niacini]